MTARDIQRTLIWSRYRQTMVLPNYTPMNWWECDLFEVTKAGYFVEYEVKLTRGDFFADRDKSVRHWDGQQFIDRNKHEALSQFHPTGPTRFWFVVPHGLVTAVEVPMWAGLVYATERKSTSPSHRVRLEVIRPAPKLHRQKFLLTSMEAAKSVCYYRMHQLYLSGKVEIA